MRTSIYQGMILLILLLTFCDSLIANWKSVNSKNSNKKDSIYFIHLNHTNPALNKDSDEYKKVIYNGFNISEFGQILKL